MKGVKEAARQNGRSISEEIEHRLELIFDREALLGDLRQVLNELPIVGLGGTEERALQ